MLKNGLRAFSIWLVAALVLAVPAAVAGARQNSDVDRVLLLLLDKVTWEEIGAAETPFIDEMVERGAAGLLSNRTVWPTTTSQRAYATISAGSRATGAAGAGQAFKVTERFMGERVAVSYERRMDKRPRGEILHLGLPALDRANKPLGYGTMAGLLGQMLKEARRTTAVFGNADTDKDDHYREAALIAGDRSGQVPVGDVSRAMLRRAPLSPYGLATDYDKLLEAVERNWQVADFLVVETGDSRRADLWQRFASDKVSSRHKKEAIEAADVFMRRLSEATDLDRTLVMIVSPSPPGSPEGGNLGQLTPIIMAGPGQPAGVMTSGSTRQPALVTSPDIAPTVLSALGVDLPVTMTGAAITVTAGRPRTIEQLAEANTHYILTNKLTTPTVTTFVVAEIIALLAAAALLLSQRTDLIVLRTVIQKALLVSLAIPLAFFAVPAIPGAVRSVPIFILACATVVALTVLSAHFRRQNKLAPPLIIVAMTSVFLIANTVLAGETGLSSVLGYSPIVAGRFYGMGNQAMSVLVASLLLLVVLVLEHRGRVGKWAKTMVVAVFLLGIAIIGWPSFGANTGGTVAAGISFAVAYVHIFHRRLAWRQVAAIMAGSVVLLGTFVLADAFLLPVKTHMGKTLNIVMAGGWESLMDIVGRKTSANIRIFRYTSWSYFLTTIGGLLAFVWWLQPKTIKERFLLRYRYLNSGLIACLVGGVIGGLANDSGVSIPALMLAYFLLVIFYLLLEETKQEPA
jgi:hypothetical protein